MYMLKEVDDGTDVTIYALKESEPPSRLWSIRIVSVNSVLEPYVRKDNTSPYVAMGPKAMVIEHWDALGAASYEKVSYLFPGEKPYRVKVPG